MKGGKISKLFFGITPETGTPLITTGKDISGFTLDNYFGTTNTHSKGEQVKIPLLPNRVGKRSRTMVKTAIQIPTVVMT